MASDCIALGALADELDSALRGARVNKIVQPEADEIRLFFRAAGGRNLVLVISCNAGAPRMHFTSSQKPNPAGAPAFCMLLRKHLGTALVERVFLHENDRIIGIMFSARTEMKDKATFFLFTEIMNRYSNIVLTDGELTILDAVKHLPPEDEDSHVVLRGVKYRPPAQSKPYFGSSENVSAVLDSFGGGDLHRALLGGLSGLTGVSVSEWLRRAGVPADCPAPLDENKKSRLLWVAAEFSDIRSSSLYAPCISGGKEVLPFPYLTIDAETTPYPSLSDAYDAFYTSVDAAMRLKARMKSISAAVKRLITRTKKNIEIDRSRLAECEKADELRIKGELIVSNIYRIKKGDTVLVCDNYYTGGQTEVELDERLSPSQNSAAYFARYAKLKRTKQFTDKKLADDLALLSYAESVQAEIDRMSPADSSAPIERELERLGVLRKKAVKGKVRAERPEPPLEYEIEGFLVLAGKNNLQNDELTFRTASAGDIWLHAKNFHGAHVIIRTRGSEVPEPVIKAAAEIAAANAGAQVEVDYTFRRNVKRLPGGHPGQVVYTDYKTVIARPDKHPELLRESGN